LLKIKEIDSKKSLIILVVSMVVVYYSIFLFFPLLYGIYGSLHNWDALLNEFDFIGLKNYIRLFNDPMFLPSFRNTFYLTAVVTIAVVIIGLTLAVAINSLNKFKGFYRTIYFLPVIVSLFAMSLVWKWMYDPTAGIFNSILQIIGLPTLRWLRDDLLALPSIMVVTIWKNYGFAMVLFLAGLTGIPKHYIEASQIDGANKIQTFRYITLPLLKPTMAFVVVISLISYLQTFIQVYVMTKHGENQWASDGTSTAVFMIYKQSFIGSQFGYGSAIAVVLFICILVISIIQLRMMRTTWKY